MPSFVQSKEMNVMKWKGLLAVLLGLLMVGTIGVRAASLGEEDQELKLLLLPTPIIKNGTAFVEGHSFQLDGQIVVMLSVITNGGHQDEE